MALVRASQAFVMEGFIQLERKKHFWSRTKDLVARIKTTKISWVHAICDEADAPEIIEEKIREQMKEKKCRESDLGNFEGWTSYRKYFEPGELTDYPEGKDAPLKLDYIREWKMEKVIHELNAEQFAVLCKELGITADEALLKK